ncbi:MAG TPA: alpha/beta hydrolase [Candidatus Acidoferrum sp.]|nr:alpha/beta hydrolase [Candidatus Acidoferrum sp.]
MLKTKIKVAIKILAAACTVLVLCGFVYERIGRAKDRRRLPQIGRSVDIGGRSLNIFCSGTGSPAVILDTGGDNPGLALEQTRAEIAKFTQACWYDRAGIGWSDSGPYPRTSAAISADLHELLKRAGIPAPYVLVGGSIGGLNSRVFAGMFPKDTAGVVFDDAAHEDEPLRAPKVFLASHHAPRALWRPIHTLFWAASEVGLLRVTGSSAAGDKNESQMTREELVTELRHQPKSFVNNVDAGMVLDESYAEARAIPSLGDIPLIALTAGKAADFGDAELNRQAEAYQKIWAYEIQPKLARLSSRGRQIVVPDATHTTIPQEMVVKAVQDVVNEARETPKAN